MENEKGFIPMPKKEYEELGCSLKKIETKINELTIYGKIHKDIIDQLNEFENELIEKKIEYDPDEFMNARLDFVKNNMKLEEAKEKYNFYQSLYSMTYPV